MVRASDLQSAGCEFGLCASPLPDQDHVIKSSAPHQYVAEL